MERYHKSKKTITVERISVTTIRRQGSQKFYCDIRNQELVPSELAPQDTQIEGEREIKLIGLAGLANEQTK